MPNMDGLEATRLIRKAGYTGPIVALSAYSDDTNIKVSAATHQPFPYLANVTHQHCHEAGMDDFVSKPIQLPRLKLVLKTFCPAEYAAEPATPTRSSVQATHPATSAAIKKDSAVAEEPIEEGISPMS